MSDSSTEQQKNPETSNESKTQTTTAVLEKESEKNNISETKQSITNQPTTEKYKTAGERLVLRYFKTYPKGKQRRTTTPKFY